jgi:hypothetical protein
VRKEHDHSRRVKYKLPLLDVAEQKLECNFELTLHLLAGLNLSSIIQ